MTSILLIVYLVLGRILPWTMSITLALYMGRKPHLLISLFFMLFIGMMEDVIYVRQLGISSLLLVTLTALIWLIERNYRSRLIWWWFGFGLVGEMVIHAISNQHLGWLAVVGQLIVLLGMYWFSKQHRDAEGIYVG